MLSLRLDALLDSPIGKLGIEIQNDALVGIYLLPTRSKNIKSSTPLAHEVVKQLSAYFDKKLVTFDLPLQISGTSCQQAILEYCLAIPHGETVSYGVIAQQLITGPRVVGNACKRNPIPIIIPCHRVVAKNHIGGYAGVKEGPVHNVKKWLLQHEGVKLKSCI